MTLVLGLGIAGITVVLRRSRSDVARAYAALKGEVDERRVAEEALRASEGRFRSLVQRASDLTIVTDDRGVVTYVSPAVEALVGYRPEDFLELPLLVHVEPEERADVATARSRCSPSGPASCARSSCGCGPTTAAPARSRRCARTWSTTRTSGAWCGTAATSPSARRWRASSTTAPTTTR